MNCKRLRSKFEQNILLRSNAKEHGCIIGVGGARKYSMLGLRKRTPLVEDISSDAAGAVALMQHVAIVILQHTATI